MKIYLADNQINRELCSELLGRPKAIGTKYNLIEVNLENKNWTTIFTPHKEINTITNKEFLTLYANITR